MRYTSVSYKKRGGFTLTELMLVVAVMGAVFAIGSQMLIHVSRFIRLNTVRIELQRDLRTNFSLINRNIRQSSQNSITIDRLPGNPPYSRISFTRVDGEQFTFYQDGTKLMMQTQDGVRTLTNDVLYMSFTAPRTETLAILSISMTLEKEIYEGGTKVLQMASEKVQVMN